MVSEIGGDPATFCTEPFALRVEKPWGYELIFTPPDRPYCGKLLHVSAGKRLSLQMHDQKLETIMLLRGRGVLLCDDDRRELIELAMQPGQGYTIVPGQRHRLIALEDCDFVEASTPETGTTFRLEDDTGRSDETEALRALERGA
jgi:mannose-6-phosphate isomerase-like protein (cupin superfamily)